MAITKKEKRDLHILMHQLRVRVDNLTKGKELNHSRSLQSIAMSAFRIERTASNLTVANNKRNLKRKKRNER